MTITQILLFIVSILFGALLTFTIKLMNLMMIMNEHLKNVDPDYRAFIKHLKENK